MLIALANMLISSSNFLFPVETVSLNTSVLEESIERDTRRLNLTVTAEDFLLELEHESLRDNVSKILGSGTAVTPALVQLASNYEQSWTEKFNYCDSLTAENRTDPACDEFYVSHRTIAV